MLTKHICQTLHYAKNLLTLPSKIDELKLLNAKLLITQHKNLGITNNIQNYEFKIFSQFGEDGILQYLIRETNLPATAHSFVEFGVENYEEANTRFLLINNNWRGMVIDGSEKNIRAIQKSNIYWRHGLTSVAAFITKDNINDLIKNAGFTGEIGILSVDIDGNDYYVWDAINIANPIIVVAEYNSVFGSEHAISVPYDPKFIRSKAHHSNLYWGCSIKALELLGKNKGYTLVGSNSAGNNVFFVRNDHLNAIPAKTAKEAYVESKFRESRDRNGNLTYLSGLKRIEEIKHLPIYDVEKDSTYQLKQIIT